MNGIEFLRGDDRQMLWVHIMSRLVLSLGWFSNIKLDQSCSLLAKTRMKTYEVIKDNVKTMNALFWQIARQVHIQTLGVLSGHRPILKLNLSTLVPIPATSEINEIH